MRDQVKQAIYQETRKRQGNMRFTRKKVAVQEEIKMKLKLQK